MTTSILRSVRCNAHVHDVPAEIDDDYDRPWFIWDEPLEYFQNNMTTIGHNTVELCIRFDRMDVLQWIAGRRPLTSEDFLVALQLDRLEFIKYIHGMGVTCNQMHLRAIETVSLETYKYLLHFRPQGFEKFLKYHFIELRYREAKIDLSRTRPETLHYHLLFHADGVEQEMQVWVDTAAVNGRIDLVEMIQGMHPVNPSANAIANSRGTIEQIQWLAKYITELTPERWIRVFESASFDAMMYIAERFKDQFDPIWMNNYCRGRRLEHPFDLVRAIHGPEKAAAFVDALGFPWTEYPIMSADFIECLVQRKNDLSLDQLIQAQGVTRPIQLPRLHERWPRQVTRLILGRDLTMDIRQDQWVIHDVPAARLDILIEGGSIYPELLNRIIAERDVNWNILFSPEQSQEFIDQIDPEIVRHHIPRQVVKANIKHGNFRIVEWLVRHGIVRGSIDESVPIRSGDSALNIYTAIKRYGILDVKDLLHLPLCYYDAVHACNTLPCIYFMRSPRLVRFMDEMGVDIKSCLIKYNRYKEFYDVRNLLEGPDEGEKGGDTFCLYSLTYPITE